MIVLMAIGWTGNKEDMSFSCKTGGRGTYVRALVTGGIGICIFASLFLGSVKGTCGGRMVEG